MPQDSLIPQPFGPLQGVHILSTGSLIAQPFAADLAAEMGAEVIQFERPGNGDVGWRNIGIRLEANDGGPPVATNWIQERRNVFCVSLDFSKPRGREIFLKLVARADIWMESSKPGTCNRNGTSTTQRFGKSIRNSSSRMSRASGKAATPTTSIARRTTWSGRPSAGMMYQTGFPDPTPPTRAAPWTGDYITALFTMWSSLAGLTYARADGKGQSIDVAQYEAIHKYDGRHDGRVFSERLVRERSGNRAQGFQPLDSFQASDGWVVMGALAEVYKRMLRVHWARSRRIRNGKRRARNSNRSRESSSTLSCADGFPSAP